MSLTEVDIASAVLALQSLRDEGVDNLAAHVRDHPETVGAILDQSLIVEANARALDLWGACSRSEVLGPVTRFWPAASRECFALSLVAIFEGRQSFSAETRVKRLDGRDVPVLYSAWSLSGDDTPSRLVVGLTDIGERVRTQETLDQLRAALAHAGRISMMGELTASISHEVNQPLGAIVANAEAGLRWLNRPEPDVDEVRELLERIVRNGRRAADIIGRMRSMSKNQAPERSRVSINALIEEAMLFLRHELSVHQASLKLDLMEEPPTLFVDRTQVQQVIVNLTMNAAQAMSEAHSWRRGLSISSRLDAHGAVAVSVQDTGPGIKPEDQERLFQSFWTTKKTGMGMGLSICRSIIEAHGGVLEVQSKPLLGATFRFTLPIETQANGDDETGG